MHFKEGLKYLINKHKLIIDTLTIDNGSENYLLDEIVDKNKIFHCDPGASYQKGLIERTHVNLRRFIKKGTSIDKLTQEDVDRATDFINNNIYKKYNFKYKRISAIEYEKKYFKKFKN